MPALPTSADRVSRAERVVLCAFLFVLPLFEVPKHLLWAAYLVLWWRARGPGTGRAGAWGGIDWVFAAAIAATVVAGLGRGAGAWIEGLREAADPVRTFATAWLIARAPFTLRQSVTALCAALAGAVSALLWGLVELQRAPPWAMLELHSVGHVNHSAIYLAISAAMAVGVLIGALSGARRAASSAVRSADPSADPSADQSADQPAEVSAGRWRLGVAAVVAAVLLISLLVAASRAALVAALAYLAVIAWAAPGAGVATPPGGAIDRAAHAPRGRGARGGPSAGGLRRAIVLLTVSAVVAYGAMLWLSPTRLHATGESVVEKFGSRPQEAGPLAFRDQLWRVAGLAFLQQPVFGIGNDRFRTLSKASLCAPPRDCGAAPLYFTSHAHSLYANTLAERGALGLASLAALLACWARAVWRGRDRARVDPAYAAVWSAALGAFLVAVLAGLLNTTLHHEHGLLSMVALGLLLAAGGRPRVGVPPTAGRATAQSA